jgi:hypothetical protein
VQGGAANIAEHQRRRRASMSGLVVDTKIQKVNFLRSSYQLTVNYDLPIEEAISGGRYTFADRDITSAVFPRDQASTTTMQIRLVHFDRIVTTPDVCNALARRKLRPAGWSELLALGRTYPMIQRQVTVVALGSFWRRTDKNHYVLLLSGHSTARTLLLCGRDDPWHSGHCFAGV